MMVKITERGAHVTITVYYPKGAGEAQESNCSRNFIVASENTLDTTSQNLACQLALTTLSSVSACPYVTIASLTL